MTFSAIPFDPATVVVLDEGRNFPSSALFIGDDLLDAIFAGCIAQEVQS